MFKKIYKMQLIKRKDIKQLKHLSAVELKSYKEDIESAKIRLKLKI